MEGQNFFVYSDENDGIKCFCWYYTRILIITSRRVFYEFIMGNKQKVMGFKAKLWGLLLKPNYRGCFKAKL